MNALKLLHVSPHHARNHLVPVVHERVRRVVRVGLANHARHFGVDLVPERKWTPSVGGTKISHLKAMCVRVCVRVCVSE